MRDMHVILICVLVIGPSNLHKVVSYIWRLKILLRAVICVAQLWLVQSEFWL